MNKFLIEKQFWCDAPIEDILFVCSFSVSPDLTQTLGVICKDEGDWDKFRQVINKDDKQQGSKYTSLE